MKLSDERPSVETSGNLEEQFFSIDDQGMIFDILRNKMYSDPILAICREISCNARDAHTEVGKKEQPVEITLPNGLEPFYKIKDWGPGISPDRMSNIFIKYTASTKRKDNIQTGGFGLGAKTPFSYSDTFTITTVHNKIKYNYACFIDETKVGKLVLMGDEPVDEENSTEISIPVKRDDFNKFYVATEQSCGHWQVKPTIKGGALAWTEYVSTLEGTGWKVGVTSAQASNRYNQYNSNYNSYSINSYSYDYDAQNKYDRGVKVIVDGIEYHVSMESLKKFTNTQIIDACKGYLFLYFDIGELTLAANRESVYVDKSTESKIIARLELVTKEISKSVNDKIESYPTYLEANKYFSTELKSTFNSLKFLGDLTWQKVKLFGPQVDIYNNHITEFYKYKTRSRKTGVRDLIKFKSRTTHTLRLEPEVKLFYNDLDIKNVSYKHVKQAFEDGAEVVQVIGKIATYPYASLDKDYHVTGVGCKMISTITSDTAVKNKAVSAAKLLVFRVYSGHYSPRFEQVAFSEIEDDTHKTKVLCFFDRSDNTYGKTYKELYLNGSKSNHTDKLATIFQTFSDDVSFYAIAKDTDEDRVKKDFADFVSLDDFVTEKIVKSKLDFVGIKAASETHYYFNYEENKINGILSLISDKSVFAQKVKAYKTVTDLKEKKYLVGLYETLTNHITAQEIKDWWASKPELDFKKLQTQCDKTYPLLVHDIYHVDVKHVAQYINFIDSL